MTGTLTSSLTVSMSHIRHIRPETLETVVIRLVTVSSHHQSFTAPTWHHWSVTALAPALVTPAANHNGWSGGEGGSMGGHWSILCCSVTQSPATILQPSLESLTPVSHHQTTALLQASCHVVRSYSLIYFHVLMSLWWESCCYSENDHQHQQQSMSEKHCAAAHECCNVQHQFVTSNTQRKW